ncbi:hypothetical protein DAETH_04790 [Deinococcus aetherius]|uniref:Uncharacterized protein n=1 Tax=Deinococcus aetherius TaxID=200252 RepID=A0ABM8A9R5_9DEIO|nr:hypothetical protein DAETH_04790 [Deinococcus aetherius]
MRADVPAFVDLDTVCDVTSLASTRVGENSAGTLTLSAEWSRPARRGRSASGSDVSPCEREGLSVVGGRSTRSLTQQNGHDAAVGVAPASRQRTAPRTPSAMTWR